LSVRSNAVFRRPKTNTGPAKKTTHRAESRSVHVAVKLVGCQWCQAKSPCFRHETRTFSFPQHHHPVLFFSYFLFWVSNMEQQIYQLTQVEKFVDWYLPRVTIPAGEGEGGRKLVDWYPIPGEGEGEGEGGRGRGSGRGRGRGRGIEMNLLDAVKGKETNCLVLFLCLVLILILINSHFLLADLPWRWCATWAGALST